MMRTALITISFLGLILTISPAFLHFEEIIEFETHKWITFLGTVMYLVSAPFWLNKKKETVKNKKLTNENN